MKNDKWFSVIMAVAILCIGAASLFNPIAYFKHIADAIVLPLFLFTVLEVIGHIRNSLFQNLDLERAKAANDEMWRKTIYKMSKDGESDEDRRIQKEYGDIVDYIVRLDTVRGIFERWFKFYNAIYILFGSFLVFSALLANLEFIVNISSKMNGTALTLFTFVIFVSEPWVVEFASDKLGHLAVKKVTELAQ
ncbi:MAG: hypothetical protein HFG60_14885 [Lachnospiraceae bacterium]|nr:hypothetical protein [Lachnospiraceae bacterium]